MSRRLRLSPPLSACVLSACLLARPLPAQQPPETQNPVQAPSGDVVTTFKASANLVLVPVVVRDKHGKHIPGLGKATFRLEENGKEQEISTFEEVYPPAGEPAERSVDLGYSNLPFDDAHQLRLTIIVLDLLNTSPLQRTDGVDQIAKFLNKGLAQNQPVSLLCITGKGLQLVHPFTSDTKRLVEALKKMPTGPPRVMPARDAAQTTVRQFKEIAQAYGGIPGRKTMIFAAGNTPELVPENSVLESGILAGDIREMWRNLAESNISVYPIQLLASAVDPAFRTRRDVDSATSLRLFADATGGNRCIETNEMMSCLAQAVEDSRSYYMLGFIVRPNDRKPGWRNLNVKVGMEHVDVHARTGFYYGDSEAPTPKSIHDSEINALASSLAYSGVPMYVRVLPPSSDAHSARTTTVEFLVTIPFNSIRIDHATANSLDLELGAIALTRDTREAGEFLHPVRGNPKPEALTQLARDGLKMREKLDLPPGYYDVRFMTRDNNSAKIGTVVFPLDVK